MAAVRVRLVGGALNGRVMWVEEGLPWLDVNIAAAGVAPQKKLRYKIEGSVGSFESEVEAKKPAP